MPRAASPSARPTHPDSALFSHFRHGHVTRSAVPWTGWIADLVLPRRCLACGTAADVLCAACVAALPPLGPPSCARCGTPTVWPVARCRECSGRRLAFASARSAVAYAGPARPLVRAWKERGVRRAASLAADVVTARLAAPEADAITHIPPDPVRQLRRGTHPAVDLARRLAERWSLEHAPLLERTETVRRQTGLARSDRGRNVRGVFRARGTAPSTVVLVDDVYTTGATASAAAEALRRAGAASVSVVTFARTVR